MDTLVLLRSRNTLPLRTRQVLEAHMLEGAGHRTRKLAHCHRRGAVEDYHKLVGLRIQVGDCIRKVVESRSSEATERGKLEIHRKERHKPERRKSPQRASGRRRARSRTATQDSLPLERTERTVVDRKDWKIWKVR